MASRSRKWFHGTASKAVADSILRSNGTIGSFLVRPSESNPRKFVMAVLAENNSIYQIRIENTGDFFQFEFLSEFESKEDEQFPTLHDLVEYYTHDGEVMVQGKLDSTWRTLELKEPIPCVDVSGFCWYHGLIVTSEAKEKMLSLTSDGVFLVHCDPEASGSEPNRFHLLVNHDKTLKTFSIQREGNQYSLDQANEFSSIAELIDHYYEHPLAMIDGDAPEGIYLTRPYNNTSFPIQNIKERLTFLKTASGDDESRTAMKDEFDHLCDTSPEHNCFEGQRRENVSKNRYKNILPFDHCRVILRDMIPPGPGCDYINASKADVAKFGLNKSYIVGQGCLPSTELAFWTMIWQQQCEIIVMTTSIIEYGKVKCMKYWPNPGTGAQYGTFHVMCVEEKETGYSVQRKFTVKNTALRRRATIVGKFFGQKQPKNVMTVRHFQFKAWPDHDVPRSPDDVLNFLRDIRHSQAQASLSADHSPLLIHCSAGIGRSGVMMALDMLIDMVNLYDVSYDISIQEVIRYMRDFRKGLVQTYEQYGFIYHALQRYLELQTKW